MKGTITINVEERGSGTGFTMRGELHGASRIGHVNLLAALAGAVGMKPEDMLLVALKMAEGFDHEQNESVRIPTSVMEMLGGPDYDKNNTTEEANP